MTVTTFDIVLAMEILIVMVTLMITFTYLLERIRELRSDVHSLSHQLHTGDSK